MFYIFTFDYPAWKDHTWHVIEASDKAQARRKAVSGSHIPESKVKFWKKKGSLPKTLAGRAMLPSGWVP
jgi:hypothetical protein